MSDNTRKNQMTLYCIGRDWEDLFIEGISIVLTCNNVARETPFLASSESGYNVCLFTIDRSTSR